MANRNDVTGGPAYPVYIMGSEVNAVDVDALTDAELRASAVPVTITAGDWHPFSISEETANDSDKTFAVPAGYEYHFLSIRVELTTTATAGNRQIAIQALDPAADVLDEIRPGLVQAASLTYNYTFSPPCADLTEIRDTDYLMTPLPIWVFTPGYSIRVYDNNAVAAAADDMQVHILLARRVV